MKRFWIYFFLLNDFSHDLFTGLWLSCLGTIVLIRLQTAAYAGPAPEAVIVFGGHLQRTLFTAQNSAMALVLVTGVLRLIHVKSRGGSGGRERRLLLVIKHIALTAIFAGGTYLGWRLAVGG